MNCLLAPLLTLMVTMAQSIWLMFWTFDLYAPSMNSVVAGIYLMDGNLCKYDASNWLTFLVNCECSLFCLEDKSSNWKPWTGNLGSLSSTYQIAAIKKIVGIGTPSHVLMEVFEVNTLSSQSSVTHYGNYTTSVEIVKWYRMRCGKQKLEFIVHNSSYICFSFWRYLS